MEKEIIIKLMGAIGFSFRQEKESNLYFSGIGKIITMMP